MNSGWSGGVSRARRLEEIEQEIELEVGRQSKKRS